MHFSVRFGCDKLGEKFCFFFVFYLTALLNNRHVEIQGKIILSQYPLSSFSEDVIMPLISGLCWQGCQGGRITENLYLSSLMITH